MKTKMRKFKEDALYDIWARMRAGESFREIWRKQYQQKGSYGDCKMLLNKQFDESDYPYKQPLEGTQKQTRSPAEIRRLGEEISDGPVTLAHFGIPIGVVMSVEDYTALTYFAEKGGING